MKRLVARFMVLFLAYQTSSFAKEVPFADPDYIYCPMTGPCFVDSVDLDGDDDLDILSISDVEDHIFWLRNETGSGDEWTKILISSPGGSPTEVQTGDIDGDGDLDLASTGFANGDIVWIENVDGAGEQWSSHIVNTGEGYAGYMSIADLDADGDLDLICPDDFYSLNWIENLAGDGSEWLFHEINDYSTGSHRLCADINQDGWLDIVSVSFGGFFAIWFENPGSDGEWIMHEIDVYIFKPIDLVVLDADLDGDPDLAVISYEFEISLLTNEDGHGEEWTKRTVASHPNIFNRITSKDVDLDGDPDLVTILFDEESIYWIENNFNNWIPHFVDTGLSGLAWADSADLNGDGYPEIFAGVSEINSVVTYSNRSIRRNAHFPLSYACNTDSQILSGSSADIDSDGDPDLVCSNLTSTEITWLENTRTMSSDWTCNFIAIESFRYSSFQTSDFDHDGDLDLAGISTNNNTLSCWIQGDESAESWVHYTIDAAIPFPEELLTCDLDGDFDPDFVVGGDALNWYENTGDPSNWNVHPIPWNQNAAGLMSGDVDRDSDRDLIVSCLNDRSAKISWIENADGVATQWIEHAIDSDSFASDLLFVDADGDGDSDIIAIVPMEEAVIWLENDGAFATWTAHTIDAGAAYMQPVATDFDADSDIDIAGTNASDYAFHFFENASGDASSWTDRIITTETVFCIDAADINMDSMMDIFQAGGISGIEPGWRPNLGGQSQINCVNMAPQWASEGESIDVFSMECIHNGRETDSEEEFSELKIYFQTEAGIALSTDQLNSLIDRLLIYRVTDEPNRERVLAATIEHPILDSLGGLSALFQDGDENFMIPSAGSAMFIISAETAVDAASQTPDNFLTAHFTGDDNLRSKIEDRIYDLPVSVSFSPDFFSATIHFVETSPTPTFTPQPSSPTPPPIPTHTPTQAPSLTPTPLTTPTMSPTPREGMGVEIDLNQPIYYPEDFFNLSANVYNSTNESASVVLAIALSIFDEYYIWSSWKNASDCATEDIGEEISLLANSRLDLSILSFTWPEGPDLPETCFIAALLNPTRSELTGQPDLYGNCFVFAAAR